MSAKPTRLIVIVAATLALAACQQQSNQSEQAPTSAPNTSEMSTNGTNSGAENSAMTPATTAKPEAQAESAGPAMTPESSPPAEAKSTTMAANSSTPPASAPAKPAMTAPEPPKPAAMAPAKPAPATTMTAQQEASPPKSAAMPATAKSFDTTKCKTCHAIDHDKVGPAWKTVVEKYGNEAALAKDFENGFKERRVAASVAKWKSKEVLMTGQFNHLIKGHAKEAAHALFETVKQGKFGTY